MVVRSAKECPADDLIGRSRHCTRCLSVGLAYPPMVRNGLTARWDGVTTRSLCDRYHSNASFESSLASAPRYPTLSKCLKGAPMPSPVEPTGLYDRTRLQA